MNTITAVQGLMRDTIAAGGVGETDYFQDGDVITDTGSSRETIESRLSSRGFCVVVDLPVSVRVMDRAPAVSQCLATIPVHVQLNTEVNSSSSGAQKTVLGIVDAVSSALLGYSGEDATDRFEHEDTAAELITNDAGLVAYVLWFRAHVVLAEKFNT